MLHLGANHTVIISKYGYVWSWGANNNYQLGDITYNVRIEKGSTTYNINTVPTISGNRETRYMTINDAVTDKGRIIASSDDNISMPPVVTISEDDVLNITKVTYDYSSGFNVAETDEHPVMYLANDPNTYSNVTWASSDENVATIENGKIIPNDNRRYSSTTISVQNMNGAIGMFILKIKRNENTVAVPMVAAGDDFSIALRADGTVWSWGNNDKGQLGLGSSVTNQDRPVQIKNLSNITYITAGQYHAGAIDKDGNVYMWGYNEFGQMGNGTSNNYNLTHHKDDHYYYDDSCWSPDSHHNHGGSSGHTHYMYNKVNNNAYTPVKLSYNFGEKIETITAGDNHTVVMTESGKVYAWGDNRYNQIGSPQTYAKSGYMGHYRYNLCSGNSNDAEITRVPLMLTPVRVRGAEGYGYLEEIIDVRAGGDFTIALKRDGTAYTWGKNDEGQSGDGTVITYTTPSYQKANMYAYGSHGNDYGWYVASTYDLKIRYEQSYKKYYPVQVKAGVQTLDIENNSTYNAGSYAYNYLQEITTISAGSKHAAVITKNGDLFTWGNGENGQLGNGANDDSNLPVKAFENAVQVASGSNQSIAIQKDSAVWAWGDKTPPPYLTFYETIWTDKDRLTSYDTATIYGRKYTETNPTNVSYQLGIADTTSTSVNTPQMVVKGNTINAKPENFSEQMMKYGIISTRGSHTVMYSTRYGTVWSWGTGTKRRNR